MEEERHKSAKPKKGRPATGLKLQGTGIPQKKWMSSVRAQHPQPSSAKTQRIEIQK